MKQKLVAVWPAVTCAAGLLATSSACDLPGGWSAGLPGVHQDGADKSEHGEWQAVQSGPHSLLMGASQ